MSNLSMSDLHQIIFKRFNAATSMCGNYSFILPKIVIREEKLLLEFETLWVAFSRENIRMYINEFSLDLDMREYMYNNYVYTGEDFYTPITYFGKDPNWEPPNFNKIRELGAMNV